MCKQLRNACNDSRWRKIAQKMVTKETGRTIHSVRPGLQTKDLTARLR